MVVGLLFKGNAIIKDENSILLINYTANTKREFRSCELPGFCLYPLCIIRCTKNKSRQMKPLTLKKEASNGPRRSGCCALRNYFDNLLSVSSRPIAIEINR